MDKNEFNRSCSHPIRSDLAALIREDGPRVKGTEDQSPWAINIEMDSAQSGKSDTLAPPSSAAIIWSLIQK